MAQIANIFGVPLAILLTENVDDMKVPKPPHSLQDCLEVIQKSQIQTVTVSLKPDQLTYSSPFFDPVIQEIEGLLLDMNIESRRIILDNLKSVLRGAATDAVNSISVEPKKKPR